MKGKQLNIFDFLENVFCEDEPINEIVEFIEKDFEKLNLILKEKEYSVWNHVPRLGKRLSMIWDLVVIDMKNINALEKIEQFSNLVDRLDEEKELILWDRLKEVLNDEEIRELKILAGYYSLFTNNTKYKAIQNALFESYKNTILEK